MRKNNPNGYVEYVKAIAEISHVATAETSLEEILGRIMRITAEAAGFEICSLWLIDESVKPSKIRLKASSFDRELMKVGCLDMNEGVIGFVASTKQPFIAKNIQREPRFTAKEMGRELGAASMASVPLQIRDGKVIGVFNCFTAEPRDFTEVEVNLMYTVAHQSSMAVLCEDLTLKTRKLQDDLEARKLVGRAKDILVQQRNFSGEEAFRWIQKRSMDSRRSMREVAEAVILSNELGYYSSIPHAIE